MERLFLFVSWSDQSFFNARLRDLNDAGVEVIWLGLSGMYPYDSNKIRAYSTATIFALSCAHDFWIMPKHCIENTPNCDQQGVKRLLFAQITRYTYSNSHCVFFKNSMFLVF